MADQAQQQQMPPPPPPQNDQQQQQQQQMPQLQQPVVNLVNQPPGQVPIVQAQVVPGANGNMDLKIQQTKLPEF